jgi:cytochrome c553
LTCALLAVACARAASPPPDRALAEAGAAIYLRGVLPSGAPLEGVESRLDVQLRAADAACVNCHQRSGLGSRDSGSGIPPITGEDLFRPRVSLAHQPAVLELEGLHGERAPYTDATLARAIRSGIDSESRPFGELMPRFELDDSSMAALVAYLKQLTPRNPPGITGALLHLGTVVTPDSDPVRRQGVLDVLEHYVAEKNASQLKSTPVPGAGRSGHTEGMGLAKLRWQLHVWQLTGTADTWRAQLERQFASDPVFALLSGVGSAEWTPVHEFCERHSVPCFFPNLEVPVASEQDFYSVYFSGGVLLEAELIAKSIRAESAGKGRIAVYQVYRPADSGEAAAAALATALKDTEISVSAEAVPAAADLRRLGEALSHRPASAIVVIWLRPVDLAALTSSSPPPGRVYVSGLMNGLEHASLPPRWREHVALSYPVELPQRRRVQLDYAVGWFAFRHIPIVDLQAQADTFLACTLLGDTLKLMTDHGSPAYLIEQLRALLEHRTLTGYYPRLALGTHQHFASKGGYLVHFGAPQGTALVAETPWLVP